MRIKSKHMKLLDAFRLFDCNHDGMLSCSELYGGLDWLGMKLTPENIYKIVQYVDKHKDGRIRFSDFEATFHDPEEETETEVDLLDEAEFSHIVIQPKFIEELYINKDLERIEKKLEIGYKALQKIEVKIEEITSWKQVWTSEGTGTRSDVSVWAPVIKENTFFGRNKYRVNLGHYASVGFGKRFFSSAKPPSSMRGFTLELTDLDKFSISSSHNLDEAHVNYLMPYPIRYKMVWWQQTGVNTFYIWKPIPPTADFVSLGMVGTKTNDEPPLDAVRCVNRGFLKSSAGQLPSCIWDNKGTGGKKGSFWIMNKLGLLTATEGHDPPEGDFYELKAAKFVAGDAFILDGQDLSAKNRKDQEKARQEALRKEQDKGKQQPQQDAKKQEKEGILKPTPAPAKQTSPKPKEAPPAKAIPKTDKKNQ